MAHALLTGVIDNGYRNVKPTVRKPAVKQADTVHEHCTADDPWAELDNNPELLERYQCVAGDLLEREDYTFEMLKADIEKVGSMEKWCRKHEQLEWSPIEWDPLEFTDSDQMQGRGCTVVTFNVGPRGIRRAIQQIVTLLARRPGVLHLQDLRV